MARHIHIHIGMKTTSRVRDSEDPRVLEGLANHAIEKLRSGNTGFPFENVANQAIKSYQTASELYTNQNDPQGQRRCNLKVQAIKKALSEYERLVGDVKRLSALSMEIYKKESSGAEVPRAEKLRVSREYKAAEASLRKPFQNISI
jgi:hypothetical protein